MPFKLPPLETLQVIMSLGILSPVTPDDSVTEISSGNDALCQLCPFPQVSEWSQWCVNDCSDKVTGALRYAGTVHHRFCLTGLFRQREAQGQGGLTAVLPLSSLHTPLSR